MRIILSLVGLLCVVAIVGLLSKRQLSAVTAIDPPPGAASSTTTGASPAAQSQQMQQQYKQAFEDAMRPQRPSADDSK